MSGRRDVDECLFCCRDAPKEEDDVSSSSNSSIQTQWSRWAFIPLLSLPTCIPPHPDERLFGGDDSIILILLKSSESHLHSGKALIPPCQPILRNFRNYAVPHSGESFPKFSRKVKRENRSLAGMLGADQCNSSLKMQHSLRNHYSG